MQRYGKTTNTEDHQPRIGNSLHLWLHVLYNFSFISVLLYYYHYFLTWLHQNHYTNDSRTCMYSPRKHFRSCMDHPRARMKHSISWMKYSISWMKHSTSCMNPTGSCVILSRFVPKSVMILKDHNRNLAMISHFHAMTLPWPCQDHALLFW